MSGPLTYFNNTHRQMLIETGTYQGATVQLALNHFRAIHSIEYDKALCAAAQKRFAGHRHVAIHHGASIEVLPKIINAAIPTTFYLDAHKTIGAKQVTGGYIAGHECPLLQEIDCIFAVDWRTQPVIVIDDARMFSEGFWLMGQYADHFIKEEWPTIFEIEQRLTESNFTATMIDDKIIARSK